MKLSDILDTRLLDEHIRQGHISVKSHPTLPLNIYNYTPECQFGNHWDNVTEQCRGLIADFDGNIIARPFRKFFNLNTSYRDETVELNLPNWTPEVTDKADGSLGLFWSYRGQFGIATRGSFTSDQALWATDWIKDQWWVWQITTDKSHTYLFEIIYPENRVVVKYDFSGLVLLSIVNNFDGTEWRNSDLNYGWRKITRVIDSFPYTSIQDLVESNRENAKGYVLTWHRPAAAPFRVKVKFEEYLRLHKLMTGMNPKALWELLRAEQSLDAILHDVPDEFYQWVTSWRDNLQAQFDRHEFRALQAFEKLGGLDIDPKDKEARKQFALRVAPIYGPLKSALFAMLDRRDYRDIIWKEIKPRGDTDVPFRQEVEAEC